MLPTKISCFAFFHGNVAVLIMYDDLVCTFATEIEIINNIKTTTIMSILSFFNKNNDGNVASPMAPALGTPAPSIETICETVQEDPTSKGNTLTVSYATGWPIDVIYGYLHKNYEEKGFNDAMVKSDLTFKEINMNIIKNKILMVFREINLNYDVMKKEIETRMETCTAAGLLTTLAELEKQLSIIAAHRVELERLERDFRNNTNEASVPLQSYECGFLRGISTIVMSMPKQSALASQPMTMPTVSSQKATA